MTMPKELVIDPVTRIEGHSKITIQVDDEGGVTDAKFHVTQFRGFEKFCEGRPFSEMPALTGRTCGIRPVSHLIASSIERIEQLLNEPDILDKNVRAIAKPSRFEGIGVAEAPRGTLMHHYKIDENGLITWVNMIIATGHNSLAMNQSVKQVAQHFVRGDKLQEGMLNRVEAVIRSYDPCLSCSTHALGQMPLHIQLVGADGNILDEIKR
jgi:coenzyme F420-reducing hydrogenase alpha subunit